MQSILGIGFFRYSLWLSFLLSLCSFQSEAQFIGPCNQGICVGQKAYNVQRDFREVEVLGLETNDHFVLRFLDNGGIGGGWSRQDLAVTEGCGRFFCVGESALNNKRQYRQVVIVGMQIDGRYVVRFSDNGGVGGNWTDDDLVRTAPAPYPPPYPAPGPPPAPQPPYPQPPYPQPGPPQQDYYMISGAGINMTVSPQQACVNQYRTSAVFVVAHGQKLACSAETCSHPYDWTTVYCYRR